MHRRIYFVTDRNNLYDVTNRNNTENEVLDYFLDGQEINVNGERVRQIIIGDKRIRDALFINDFGGKKI